MIRIVAVSLALACLLAGFQARAEVQINTHGVAVIIGNKAYPGRTPNAEYAHNDAAAMKKFVIDGLGYRPGNIIDLRDATKGQMEAVFGTKETHKGKLFNWMRPGKSDVMVFYSGHGVPGLQDKRGYLLPVDGDPNLAEITGFPVDRLYANLAKLPARSITVFLDACFSGETPKGMLVRAASGLTVTPRAPETARALTVITAAQGDQFASWDEDAKHGLFTRHLLLALTGKADGSAYGNSDGKVSLDEAKKYLDEEMTYQARRRYGREQVASVQGGGGVVLASYDPKHRDSIVPPSVQIEEIDTSYVAVTTANVRAKPTTSAAKVGKIARDAAVTVTGKVRGGEWLRVERPGGDVDYIFGTLLAQADEAEIAAWGEVKDTKTVDDVAGFLRSYPNGHFSVRAKKLKMALTPKMAVIIPSKISEPKPSKSAVRVYPNRYSPGDSFRDCEECPEMIVIPPGSFKMGYLQVGGNDDEKPVHEVRFTHKFAVGKFEVTFAQWELCASDGGCGRYIPDDERRGRNQRPVVNVNWDDAKLYVAWLSKKTGQKYRLMSEAEWEYVTRAGSTTKYFWGEEFVKGRVDVHPAAGTRDGGAYEPNGFGIYDLVGNVWEWVEDCGHDNYQGAPSDGSAWTVGGDCSYHGIRGGSWGNFPRFYRSAFRERKGTKTREFEIGFRVAKTLTLRYSAASAPKQVSNIIPPKVTSPMAVKPAVGVYPKRHHPGDTFKDCDDCPEMVVIPPGQFRMGDLSGDGGEDEKPTHEVRIGYSFAVGKFEVTQAQWRTVMGNSPDHFEGNIHPVEGVSWANIQGFIRKLNARTGLRYRLLSEAEWEYVARAGTTTKYHWGEHFDNSKVANGWSTEAVGTYGANGFGLYDMHGNVGEWTEDCWHNNYENAPTDGSSWTSFGNCTLRVLRGGSWGSTARHLRAAFRYGDGTESRGPYRVGGRRVKHGFRVARTLSR
jgi:formylglycine-generating enzyme required for sulfatase activity